MYNKLHDNNPEFLYPETPTPASIVALLDEDVVGQDDAKRAVAIALRNRWRRLRVEHLKDEISPKNILMIGPTGVGKTEIARRIAHMVNAPFVKVEATKFTEVGYVGRDVDSIVRDLVAIAIQKVREHALDAVQEQAAHNAEEIILDALQHHDSNDTEERKQHSEAREVYRKKLRSGELDERVIDIETRQHNYGVEIMVPQGMEDISSQLQNIFDNIPDKGKAKKMSVKDARQALTREEAQNLVSEEQIRNMAVRYVEENGIVFIDEIDKVVKSTSHGSDVSREGVQRDLLPLIEGSTVQTKYGNVKTNHILFIASGAFMGVKPSDMISELQGRLPIRVELKPLSSSDFVRILTEPRSSLIKQYQALLATEQVSIDFTDEGIQSLADIAYKFNEKSENIGARRLHTMMEKLLESVSYNASEQPNTSVRIDKDYVTQQLNTLIEDDDLSKWIL